MTMKEITAALLTQFPNAVPCRTDSMGNFLAVPCELNEEGVQTYAAVKVSALLSKPTKVNPAFDVEAAHADYEAFAAKQAEKAAKPKKSAEPDPVKVAAKQTRQAALMAYMKENAGVEMTSQEIFTALSDAYSDQLIMAVGSDLNALAKEDSNLTFRKEKQKKYWTYNVQ